MLQLVRGQEEENEGMAGAGGVMANVEKKHTGCQVACGMLGFVCISECFVCKSKGLKYLRECVGGREAAEKHLELYENPGISTLGNRIAAYQTYTRLYAHKPTNLTHTYCRSSWLTTFRLQSSILTHTLGKPQSTETQRTGWTKHSSQETA